MLKIMFLYIMCVLLFPILISGTDEEDKAAEEAVRHPALARLIKMRCTRRFSPGVCVDDVAPVWTFVFLSQNCTERLGCPNHYRTNRFRTYRLCMRRCRPLIDMYLQMVEFEEKNSTINFTVDDHDSDQAEMDDRNLRVGVTKQPASSSGKKEIALKLEDLSDDLEEEEYPEEQETHVIVYKDMNLNEDVMTPDVDYIAGEIRSEIDMLHW